MATGWSNYQVTQGYMEWFYDVKFAVVTLIALGFAWYSISRVIAAVRSDPPRKPAGSTAAKDENDASAGQE